MTTEILTLVVSRTDQGLVAAVTPDRAGADLDTALEWMAALRLAGELLGEIALDTMVIEHSTDLDEL